MDNNTALILWFFGFLGFCSFIYTRCNHEWNKTHTTKYEDCYKVLFYCEKCGKFKTKKV